MTERASGDGDAAASAVAAAAVAADGGGAEAALRALRTAAVWTARELAGELSANAETTLPERGTSALRVLVGLDDALTALAAVAPAIDSLAATALAGPSVESYLRTTLTDLDRLRTRIDEARRRGEELERRESEIRALVERHAALREKITELRRLQQLGDALGELVGQQAALDARLEALHSAVNPAEQRLRASADELVTLTSRAREQLTAENHSLLTRLDDQHRALLTAEAEHVRLTAETAAASARLAELAEIRDGQLAVLRAHARADESVAQALPGVEALDVALPNGGGTGDAGRVKQILERVDALLTGVDDALADAFAAADVGAADATPRS